MNTQQQINKLQSTNEEQAKQIAELKSMLAKQDELDLELVKLKYDEKYCYLTKDNTGSIYLQDALSKYKEIIERLNKEDNNWVADWNDLFTNKYYLSIDHLDGEVFVNIDFRFQTSGAIYMSQNSIEKLQNKNGKILPEVSELYKATLE